MCGATGLVAIWRHFSQGSYSLSLPVFVSKRLFGPERLEAPKGCLTRYVNSILTGQRLE